MRQDLGKGTIRGAPSLRAPMPGLVAHRARTHKKGCHKNHPWSSLASMTNTTVCPSSILAQAKSIMTNPSGCWTSISGESKDPKQLTISYLLPLTVAGAIAAAIGLLVFGTNVGLITFRPSVGQVIGSTIFKVAVGTLVPFVGAWVIARVSGFFNGSADFTKTFTWLVYSSTPCLLGGLLAVHPGLGALAAFIGGIFALYVCYKGVTPMLSIPESSAIPFVAVAIISLLVVSVLTAFVLAGVMFFVPGATGAVVPPGN